MGFGGGHSMISSLKNNKLQLSKRKKYFDKEHGTKEGSYQEFTDHKKMKTYEYAAFQKKLFLTKKREQRKFKLIVLLTVLIVIVLFLTVPWLIRSFFEDVDPAM